MTIHMFSCRQKPLESKFKICVKQNLTKKNVKSRKTRANKRMFREFLTLILWMFRTGYKFQTYNQGKRKIEERKNEVSLYIKNK